MEKNKENTGWKAEKKMYVVIYASRTGKSTKIIDIIDEDELGYTGSDGYIYIKEIHPIMDGMSAPEKSAFRTGVFCHEMLHQIFTDFPYFESILEKLEKEPRRREIFSLFVNLIEDPAIEHRAPETVGGYILKALNYSIRVIYEKSKEIQDSDSPFSELCNALIQFGDMGLIKGHFSDEVYPYFKKIAPEFNAQILNPVSSERMEQAAIWTEMTRPLWEKMSDEELKQSCDEIMDNASSKMQSAGNQPEQEQSEQGQSEPFGGKDGEIDKKREELLEKLERGEEVTVDENTANEEAKNALSITAVDLQNLESEIFNNMDSFDQEITTSVKPMTIPQINMKEYSRQINKDILADPTGLRESYLSIVESLKKNIRALTRSFTNILLNDYNEDIRSTSGRYNIKRGLTNTSVKVFDKRKEMKNIKDMAVTILVDQSGSMGGDNIKNARDAAITLTEVFSNLNIPCSVMGFTADTDNADIVHRHFVSFRNLAVERTSLAGMTAYANNYDGYSIRYAGRIMMKQKAEHKILFVISDGYPNCNNYKGKEGIEDTTLAIREMSRHMTVMGIGIGGNDKVFHKMYNGNFVNTTPDKLAVELAKQLKRIVRTY